jgi:hypothetical protein
MATYLCDWGQLFLRTVPWANHAGEGFPLIGQSASAVSRNPASYDNGGGIVPSLSSSSPCNLDSHCVGICAPRLCEGLGARAKFYPTRCLPPPFVRRNIELSARASAPILPSKRMSFAAKGVMMQRPVGENHTIVPFEASRMDLASDGDRPDVRLVELVRLLARRAARQWYKKMMEQRRAD